MDVLWDNTIFWMLVKNGKDCFIDKHKKKKVFLAAINIVWLKNIDGKTAIDHPKINPNW